MILPFIYKIQSTKMKKIIVFGICLFSMIQFAKAQLRAGLKFGVSSDNLITNYINVPGQSDFADLKLALHHANYGVHGGVWAQLKLFGIFVQPEIMLNSSSAAYTLTQLGNKPVDIIKHETYNHLDVPILLGVKLGPLQLGAGPVGHAFISSSSDLFTVNGYSQTWKRMTYGYQANVALVIGKLYFDVRYESNFSKFGDHFTFYGKQYSFDQSPARVIGNLGFAF